MNTWINYNQVLPLAAYLALAFCCFVILPVEIYWAGVRIVDWFKGYNRPIIAEEHTARMVGEVMEVFTALRALPPDTEDVPKKAEVAFRELVEKHVEVIARIIPRWWI